MSDDSGRIDGSPSVSLAALRGLRLGRCARRILLLAPLPSAAPAILTPAREGRAAACSHQRAMRQLAAHGLVELTWKTEIVTTKQVRRAPAVVWDPEAGAYREVQPEYAPVERAIGRRAVRLTDLGALLVANTAGFHFAMIEQGGTSLYPSLAQRVTHPEVLRILLSIGPTETMHFQTWQDKAGNAVAPPLAPLTDSISGLTFPDLTSAGEELQPNLIMPEPTRFLDRKFPVVSIIRPTETEGAAMGAVKFLTQTGLFIGQSRGFFAFMTQLAREADAAHHDDN